MSDDDNYVPVISAQERQRRVDEVNRRLEERRQREIEQQRERVGTIFLFSFFLAI